MYLLVTLFLLQSVNMQTDWKIITVFVGGNDLCDFCEDQVRDTRFMLHPLVTFSLFPRPLTRLLITQHTSKMCLI